MLSRPSREKELLLAMADSRAVREGQHDPVGEEKRDGAPEKEETEENREGKTAERRKERGKREGREGRDQRKGRERKREI